MRVWYAVPSPPSHHPFLSACHQNSSSRGNTGKSMDGKRLLPFFSFEEARFVIQAAMTMAAAPYNRASAPMPSGGRGGCCCIAWRI